MEVLRTGIAGFDAATGGGIPRGSRTILYGPPGAGKTVFGMQFLWAGMSAGEKVACNSIDRPFGQVRNYFRSFGWDVGPHESEGRFIPLQSFPTFAEEDGEAPAEHVKANDLGALRELGGRLASQGLTRLVSGDFSQAGFSLTGADQTIATSDWLVDWAYHHQVAWIDVITATQIDVEGYKAWSFSLKAAHNVIQFRFQSGRREIRILKLEGANHPLDWVPIAIGPQGIEMGIA